MPLEKTKSEETREQAWQRLLRQLEARQQYVNRIAERDRQEQIAAETAEQRALREQEEVGVGASAVRGAQMGTAIQPGWGTLIGAIAGKGFGSIGYGAKHGAWEGIKKFHDPRPTGKALLGTFEGQQRGASMAGTMGKARARSETLERAPAGLESGREMERMRPAMGTEPRYGKVTPSEGTSQFKFSTAEERARSEALDRAIEEERLKKKKGV